MKTNGERIMKIGRALRIAMLATVLALPSACGGGGSDTTAVDSTPPRVVSTNPAGDATGVKVDAVITLDSANGTWAYAYTGVNSTTISLATDYAISTTRNCDGMAGAPPTSCSETWNLSPVQSTTPNADTES